MANKYIYCDSCNQVIETLIHCDACNKQIGTKKPNNKSKFSVESMPAGAGSALYDYWRCKECDPNAYKNYLFQNEFEIRTYQYSWVMIDTIKNEN